MSSFISTRGGPDVSLREAVLRGLAPDAGLYVPREIPRLPDTLPAERDLVTIARWAAPTLIPDVDPETLDRVIGDALSFPTPLVEVEPDVHVLELFHGPTNAFKDIGARFLARLAAALDPGGPTRTVLVATSGDTGGAVADAFRGVEGFDVVVLFPIGGVSARQRRQMTTLGGNVSALGVRGTFDDCQRIAKEAFMDPALRGRYGLTSANSINVGRLLPQAFYYIYAAARLGWASRPASFVVPCGNLGNLFAGLLARHAGMPAAAFVAASNSNRAFADFLRGHDFEARPSVVTFSNAMDVGAPSNFERLMWLFGSDPAAMRRDVLGVSVDDAATVACIADVYERTGYVLDPHAAVAYTARSADTSGAPTVVLATAHPAKFPEVTEAAIGRAIPLPEGLLRALRGEERMVEIEPTLAALREALHERIESESESVSASASTGRET
jgi:threonine synthase